jgi:DNA mismatch repair protein MutS
MAAAVDERDGRQADLPMIRQYRRLKEQHRDAVLFFRLGDFYEMFEQDAREVSALLDLTLTSRNGLPMCGIPYHASQTYIARLLKAGRKVAVCEQTEMPRGGRGLARREVVEVITPGTLLDETFLEQGSNNYLVAIGARPAGSSQPRLGLAYADLSTGEFRCTSFEWVERSDRLRRELERLAPREILVQEALLADPAIAAAIAARDGVLVNRLPDWSFDTAAADLARQLKVASLKGFGLEDDSPEVVAAGAVLAYVAAASRTLLPHITAIQAYRDAANVLLDETTQRNLELLRNLSDGSRRYTLLAVLDHTRTSMGARMLKRWILAPLTDRGRIDERLADVDSFYRDQTLLSRVRETLGRFHDLERLTARVATERAHGRDLLAVLGSLQAALALADLLAPCPGAARLASALAACLPPLRELADTLKRAIADNPPVVLTEGNLIREGYNAELDRLRAVGSDTRRRLHALLKDEQEASGIPSLKLRHNRVLGYFLEVTRANAAHVPPHFARRQSMANAERFTTPRLADLENEFNSAAEAANDLEKRLFLEVRDRVRSQVETLLACGHVAAETDTLQSLAMAATVHGLTRPRFEDGDSLVIEEGRHPVVEAYLPPGAFVPNSLRLGAGAGRFVLLTGPNMAGKSTFLRQVALIVLMAQAGSFVPARQASLPLVDRIFCRVGATDNLARGESTFLVEMNETANIVRSATRRSLVVMDEVGRGTGTSDGLAIAWSVSAYLMERIGAFTLFATHYHELAGLGHPDLVRLCMDVEERGGEILFLKRVRSGSSDNSYGLHVARLAGLPAEIIDRARALLQRAATQPPPTGLQEQPHPAQPELFGPGEILVQALRGVDPEKMTPLEALNLLARWKQESG